MRFASRLPARCNAVPLLSVARHRDRARAIADEIQNLPPIDEAPNALSALTESPARLAQPRDVAEPLQ